MQTNQNFFEEIEKLVSAAVSKTPTPIKRESLKISERPNKIFFENKNRIDVKLAWEEIEKLFDTNDIRIKINSDAQEKQEEHKVAEQIDILKTPQPKVFSPSLQTTKMKEPKEECEKRNDECLATRRLTFNLD